MLAYHCSEGGFTVTVTIGSPTVTITELPTASITTATNSELLAIENVPLLTIIAEAVELPEAVIRKLLLRQHLSLRCPQPLQSLQQFCQELENEEAESFCRKLQLFPSQWRQWLTCRVIEQHQTNVEEGTTSS